MFTLPSSARDRFTREDFEFILETLVPGEVESEKIALLGLMADPEEANRLFDHPALFKSLSRIDAISKVSARFFLYVCLRHSLPAIGIEDRSVADYLAEKLHRFVRFDQGSLAEDLPNLFDYEYELQLALLEAVGYRRFELHCFGGDRSLFLAGFFPGFLRHRKERHAAPDLNFYEEAGRSHYRIARDHPLAGEFNQRDTLDLLFNGFPLVRCQLNHLVQEHLS
ncbi:MAG: hypothetical protein ACFCU4_07635 [Puniceicoccaceae bacterium]